MNDDSEFIKNKRKQLENLYQNMPSQEDQILKRDMYLLTIELLDLLKKESKNKWSFFFWIGFHSCWIGVVFSNIIQWFLLPVKIWIYLLYGLDIFSGV